MKAHIHGCLDSRRSHGTRAEIAGGLRFIHACAVPQASRPAVRRDVRGQQGERDFADGLAHVTSRTSWPQ